MKSLGVTIQFKASFQQYFPVVLSTLQHFYKIKFCVFPEFLFLVLLKTGKLLEF